MLALLAGLVLGNAPGGSAANTGQPVFVHRKIGSKPCELVQRGSLVTTKEFAWVEIEGEKPELYSPEMGPSDYLSASTPISGRAAKDAHKSGFELRGESESGADLPRVRPLGEAADCPFLQSAITEIEGSRALRRTELQTKIYKPGNDDGVVAATPLKESVTKPDQNTATNKPSDGTSDKTSKKMSGTVVLDVLIGAEGTVQQTRIVRSANPELDKKAAEAVSRWKFTPARKKGLPVPSVMPVEIDFHLE